MNRQQREARDENVKVLARNYPGIDAVKLQNKLYVLSLKCERNALGICGTEGHFDQRDALRSELKDIGFQFGILLHAEVTGDPRGFCLKLHLPDRSYNTWGGVESGWGIGSGGN